MVNRFAFSMIELIFAIVIIGISVISLPMMSQVIASNSEKSLVQEAIYAASAELNQILSYHWDENSIEGNASLSRVVWTPTSTCDNNTKLRPGHINQTYHRRCTDDNTLIASFPMGPDTGDDGLEEDDDDDIDDVSQTTHSIFINPNPSSSGYKKDYNSTLTITYANFGTIVTADRNMKRIDVTISDASAPVVQLTTFSANIGEIDYHRRYYP